MTEPAAWKPTVLFVCERNAGRSQMASGYLAQLARGAVEVRSAGRRPAGEVSPEVVSAMAEEGIDISAERPKELTPEALEEADLVITLGSGSLPVPAGKRSQDWDVADPKGKGLEAIRPLRDEIKGRVQQLLTELLPAIHPDAS